MGIILFDGVCNLCNGAVQFILKRDPSEYFKFASLQSDYAEKLMAERGIERKVGNSTLILIENGEWYFRSTAALRICGHLSGAWRICYLFLAIPRFIRDGLYDYISRHRNKWFGKREQCMVPDQSVKHRFLGISE